MGGFVLKDKRKRMTMIEKYLSMFPILSKRKNQLAGNLSGGEQQMLAMARALMSNYYYYYWMNLLWVCHLLWY